MTMTRDPPPYQCKLKRKAVQLIERINTPIQVSHNLVQEVYFSVYGEDQLGRRMARPMDGGLRVMRIKRSVVVPSVSCGYSLR